VSKAFDKKCGMLGWLLFYFKHSGWLQVPISSRKILVFCIIISGIYISLFQKLWYRGIQKSRPSSCIKCSSSVSWWSCFDQKYSDCL